MQKRVYTGQKKRNMDVKVQVIKDNRKIRMELKLPTRFIKINEKVKIEDDFFTIEFICTKKCDAPYLIIPIFWRLNEEAIKSIENNRNKRMNVGFKQENVSGKIIVAGHMLLADAFASTDQPMKLVDECILEGESKEAKNLTYSMRKYNTKCNFTLTIPRKVMIRTKGGKLTIKDEKNLDVSITFKRNFNLNQDFSVTFDILYNEREKYDMKYEQLKKKRVRIENDFYVIDINVGKQLYRATDWANCSVKKPEKEKNVITPYLGFKFLPKNAYGGMTE